MKLLIQAVLIGAALALPSSLNAETTLDSVLDQALNESPMVKEIEVQIATQRSVGIATTTMKNAELDAEIRFPTSSGENRGSDEIAVSLSQPLRPSDFGARARVNRLIAATAKIDRQIELLGFSQRIALAYAKAWAMKRREGELKGYLKLTSAMEQTVKSASEGGFLSPGEGLLFGAEAKKVRYQLTAISTDANRAQADLSKLVGFSVEDRLVRPEISKIPTLESLFENATLPTQERAKLALTLAKEQQKLSELDAYPSFAPKLVYERTNDSQDYVGLGISIDLPFSDRNQADRLVRSAEASAAQSQNRYFAGDGFKNEVRALSESLSASAALLNGYEEEIIPMLQEALRAEEKMLNSGQGSVFRVWQTLRELSSAEEETIERLIKFYTDKTELVVLTGTDF